MNKEICPFGSRLQNYWNKLSALERKMHLDVDALYSLDIQAIAANTAKRIRSKKVMDAFCGAGGASIAMARAGKIVTAVDLYADRLEMAMQNAALFRVEDRITFVEGDALKLLPELEVEAVYLDPPWGGPEYARQSKFSLAYFVPDGSQVLQLALKHASEVIFKVPKNFNFLELKAFGGPREVVRNEYDGHLEYYTLFFWK